MRDPPLTAWADELEAAVAALASPWVDRVAVVAETASTQDAASAMCGGRGGLLLVAGRQTAGRGRLGRRWADDRGLGLAMTIVLGPGEPGRPIADAGRLSLAAGLAACAGAERALGVAPPDFGVVGLRWPNDAVERATGRKLAGVLIEVRTGLALVGIGMNVHQSENDWPDDLRARAVSLRQLGASCSRPEACAHVVCELDALLRGDADAIDGGAQRADVLRGTRRVFSHDGLMYSGVVASISHAGAIVLSQDDGATVELPALATRLVAG